VLQEVEAGGIDGWELALDEIVVTPDRFLGRLRVMHIRTAPPMQPDDALNPLASRRPTGAGASQEAAVSQLWRTLLGLPENGPQIGIDENFFEVGGTSLLATLLLKRINAAFEKNLPIASVFEPTGTPLSR